MKKENLTDKLNEQDAHPVTPQEFEQVWGYTKEEYLNRMMGHIRKRKTDELLDRVKKANELKGIDLDITEPDVQEWIVLSTKILQKFLADNKENESRLYLRTKDMKDEINVIGSYLLGISVDVDIKGASDRMTSSLARALHHIRKDPTRYKRGFSKIENARLINILNEKE